MNKHSIGYRLSFDYIVPQDIENFIKDYLKFFDRFEIKLTEDLVSYGELRFILKVSEKLASGKYSIHIYKDVLYNDKAYENMAELIKVLEKFEPSNKVYLITHIPYGNCSEYLPKVLELASILPKNYVLLLENIDLDRNNVDYLKQINNMCKMFEANNIENVGICFDIGHFLYGCSKENISESMALLMLQENQMLLSKVMQIHLHDYNKQAHLQLNTGIMNLDSVSEFIVKNKLDVPIIIESRVKSPEDDGIKQIKIMEELLG